MLQTQPCHHVSQPVSLKRLKCASWLIRAGIQPPRLHLTICCRATYSIISCPTWRVSLSLTQAESEVSLYLLHKSQQAAPRLSQEDGGGINTLYIYLTMANEAKFGHSVAPIPQEEAKRHWCVQLLCPLDKWTYLRGRNEETDKLLFTSLVCNKCLACSIQSKVKYLCHLIHPCKQRNKTARFQGRSSNSTSYG